MREEGLRKADRPRSAPGMVPLPPIHGTLKRHPIMTKIVAISIGQLGVEEGGNLVAPHAHFLAPASGAHMGALIGGTVAGLIARDVVADSQWYQRRAHARELRKAHKAAERVGMTVVDSNPGAHSTLAE